MTVEALAERVERVERRIAVLGAAVLALADGLEGLAVDLEAAADLGAAQIEREAAALAEAYGG